MRLLPKINFNKTGNGNKKQDIVPIAIESPGIKLTHSLDNIISTELILTHEKYINYLDPNSLPSLPTNMFCP